MTNSLSFAVEIEVDESVDESRVKEVMEEMLSDMTQDELYESVTIRDPVSEEDEAIYELFDMLGVMSDEQVDHAIDAVRRLSDDE